jgi:hypothetical protein
MSSHGRLILKFTDERVSELSAAGIGIPFCPSPDRPMKGWIEVTRRDADWVALAREAHRIATAVASRQKKSASDPLEEPGASLL